MSNYWYRLNLQKHFGPQIWAKWAKILVITQDYSLRQLIASSRAEISKKKCGPNKGRNDLLESNVFEHPLKLACFVEK